jgi:hypothetical protein
MEKYYKILGVDALTPKPLVKIAYAHALSYAREENIKDAKMLEVHLAYQLIGKYRLRFSDWTKGRKKTVGDHTLKDVISDTENQIKNGRVDTFLLTSKTNLEIVYCFRTLLLGIFPMLLFLFTEMFVDFTRLTRDARDFFASLFFYFALFNLLYNWIDMYYSVLFFFTAVGLVIWRLNSFEKKVITALSRHLNEPS